MVVKLPLRAASDRCCGTSYDDAAHAADTVCDCGPPLVRSLLTPMSRATASVSADSVDVLACWSSAREWRSRSLVPALSSDAASESRLGGNCSSPHEPSNSTYPSSLPDAAPGGGGKESSLVDETPLPLVE